MTVDNLVSADVVGADGTMRRASATENPDLFWALRGGGGNFGIVTRFEFALHPIPAEVVAGLLVFPMDHSREILQRYRTFVERAPEALNVWAVLRKAPPLPFLPAEVHGQGVVVLAVFYAGDPGEAAAQIDALRAIRSAARRARRPGAVRRLAAGLRPAARARCAQLLEVAQLHRAERRRDRSAGEYAGRLPSDHSEIFVALVSGAANRVPTSATAYAGRDAQPGGERARALGPPVDDEACVRWARAFYAASAPFASGGAYVNFMTADEAARVPAAYGANYARLVELKRQFDPDNVFRTNQNIAP